MATQSSLDAESSAAVKLQKLSRSFLAKKVFKEEAQVRKALDEEAGVHAPFVPTPTAAVELFVNKFVQPGDTVCDLGCGDGRVLLACQGKIAKGLGVDIQEGPLLKAKQASDNLGFNNMQWLQADFFNDKVSRFLHDEANVVFLFLLPEILSKLVEYLAKTLSVGSRIICYTFSFGTFTGFKNGFIWTPVSEATIPGLPGALSKLYEYNVDEFVKANLK
jgi:SAM-dependent methyltransferase